MFGSLLIGHQLCCVNCMGERLSGSEHMLWFDAPTHHSQGRNPSFEDCSNRRQLVRGLGRAEKAQITVLLREAVV